MKKCLILVEGQTEERCVTSFLRPHLQTHGVWLIPKIITTKRVKAGPDFKGGVTGYRQVKKDLIHLLGDTSADVITTLIDYYALPEDFPGMPDRPPATPLKRVTHVENSFAADVSDRRFLPHLILHEFEAWIFADLSSCSWVFDSPDVVTTLQGVRESVSSPEEIDEDPQTAPSKRIVSAYPPYQKALQGPMAVEAIGVDTIREQCPHFDKWMTTLERAGI